jgi:hypothetical protein
MNTKNDKVIVAVKEKWNGAKVIISYNSLHSFLNEVVNYDLELYNDDFLTSVEDIAFRENDFLQYGYVEVGALLKLLNKEKIDDKILNERRKQLLEISDRLCAHITDKIEDFRMFGEGDLESSIKDLEVNIENMQSELKAKKKLLKEIQSKCIMKQKRL